MISILKLINHGRDIAGRVVVAHIGVETAQKRREAIKIMLLFVTVWGVVTSIVNEGRGTQETYWVIMILTII